MERMLFNFTRFHTYSGCAGVNELESICYTIIVLVSLLIVCFSVPQNAAHYFTRRLLRLFIKLCMLHQAFTLREVLTYSSPSRKRSRRLCRQLHRIFKRSQQRSQLNLLTGSCRQSMSRSLIVVEPVDPKIVWKMGHTL